jgi:Tol biopolymer transport system component
MPAAGGAPQRLLANPGECVSPSWSVAANKICFAMRQGQRYVIAMVEMSNGTLPIDEFKVLVDEPGDWESPAWAPDGRHIVCSRTTGRSGKTLYMIDSLFGTLVPLQNFTGNDTSPTYSPLP